MNDPATDRQLDFLDKRGIEYNPDITKLEASALIDELTGNKPRPRFQPRNVTRKYPEARHAQPDWDKIAVGKVRSLFLQAHIQKNGLVKLKPEEKEALIHLVDDAMLGPVIDGM